MITVNGRIINYTNGMTVSDAIKAAGDTADDVTLVLVDGMVLTCGFVHDQLLEDGACIKLLRIISGG